MSYQSRIREIQSAFMLGFQDRDTCISMFESLLHEYGMLPVEEQLDRTITNENFLALLKMAKEHRGIHDAQPTDPSQKLENLKLAEDNLRKLTRWMERMAQGGDDRRFRIADSVNRQCPVCRKPTTALFNRVQSLDHQTMPVEPPRCQDCMMKWVAERFGTPVNTTATPATTVDGSPTSPLSSSEADFFAEYEKQMQEPQS
jgi:hypothetical protein